MVDQDDDQEVSKLVSMIIKYNEQFFERHSDQADQMVDIILKIVNITDPSPKIVKKKRDLLRKALVYITNLEIIDTVTNLYVYMVCQEDERMTKEIIEGYLQGDFQNSSVFEEKMLCKICNGGDKDLHMINEGFYLAFQAFEGAKMQEFEEIKEELSSHLLILDILDCLQKCTFLCKDSQESRDEESNKFFKLKNLISCLKGKNEDLTIEDLPVDSDEILEDLITKTNDLHKQVSTAVNESRIKLKEEELLGNKTKKIKLTQDQQREVHIVKSLVEVTSLEEMERLVQEEIAKYDEGLEEEEKKNLFLEKYGRKVARSVNFYYLLSTIYGKHNPVMLENLQTLLFLMPNFYLPLYFFVNHSFFDDSSVPPVFTRSLISPYRADRDGRLLHDLLLDYVEKKILPEPVFLFFSETVRHLSETNIFQLQNVLESLALPALGESLLFCGLLVKKILLSVKYIDVYDSGREFIDNGFNLLPLDSFKEKINEGSGNEQAIVKEFVGSVVKICKDLEGMGEEEMRKVEEMQRVLEEKVL